MWNVTNEARKGDQIMNNMQYDCSTSLSYAILNMVHLKIHNKIGESHINFHEKGGRLKEVAMHQNYKHPSNQTIHHWEETMNYELKY